MSEQLCLRWNDFQNNTKEAFGTLRCDADFSDVTLASEDGRQVEAHRVILATSSPFFSDLLRRNKHRHPLIYMRGVNSVDLVAVVDFLYYGEASVYQGNIDSFLALAGELNLRGLTEHENTEQKEKPEADSYNNKDEAEPDVIEAKTERVNPGCDKDQDQIYSHNTVIETVQNYQTENVNITDINELDETVKSMITKNQNRSPNGRRPYSCTVCGKEGPGNNLRDHIEANHLEGVCIPCNFCGKTFRCRSGLRMHNTRYH